VTADPFALQIPTRSTLLVWRPLPRANHASLIYFLGFAALHPRLYAIACSARFL